MTLRYPPSSSAGSPAWAGIDLREILADAIAPGFPRVGGDRPTPKPCKPPRPLVPPRGRG